MTRDEPSLPAIDLTFDLALRHARAKGVDALDAQLLLLRALGRSSGERAWLKAHGTEPLAQPCHQVFIHLIQRRLSGEPVAYLLGEREFFGLLLQVDWRVLVPRPETEILVEWALELLAPIPAARVLDLGTGSGAIALALKSQRPDLHLVATDASQDALTVASGNARRLGLDVQFKHGFWLDPVVGPFDLIVANPPYIRDDDPHLTGLGAEPRSALVAASNGMADLHHIIGRAGGFLRPDAFLVLEHGYDQAEAVRFGLLSSGFGQIQTRRDLAAIERCSAGCRVG